MATVGAFNVALVASTSRFVSAISQAEQRWNNFARSIQRNSKTMPKAIQSVTPAALSMARTIVMASAVAGTALTGLGAVGIKLAADFEQTQIAFTTLLGDAQRAKQFLSELDIFARKTPFNTDALRQSARQLLAFGFSAEKVLPMLTPIGDAVAAMGGNQEMLEQIIRALGQMQAKQKVSAEEMLQLTEAGISAWQMLAEGIGTTVPEAMKRAEKGLIPSSIAIEAILNGMTRRFRGAMEAQSKTILGQWEQVKEGMTVITRGFGQDIIRIFGIATAMERLNAALGRFADAVSRHGFVGSLSRAFPPWLPPVIVAIAGAIGGALVPVIVSWLIPALKKLGVSLWTTLKPLFPWMAIGAAVAATVYLLARYWGQLPAIANAAWSAVNAIVLYSASIIVRGTGAIISAISFLVPAFKGVAQAVYGWADSLKSSASQAMSTAKAALQSAQSTKAAADSAQKQAKTAQQAAQAQEGLGDAMQNAAKKAADNIQSFDEVHQIQDEMGSTADMAAGAVKMPEIAVPGAPDVAGGIGAAMGSIADAVDQAYGKIASVFERLQKVLQPLSNHLEDIAGVIAITLLPRFIALGGRMLEVVTSVGKLGEALKTLRGALVSLGEALKNTQLGRWFIETAAIANAKAAEIVMALKSLDPSKIFAAFRENALVRYITEAVVVIRSKFTELATVLRESAIAKFFAEIGSKLAEIGSWAGRLVAPFKVVWEWIVKTFEWVTKLWDVLTKIPFLGPILKLAGHFAGILGWILLIIDAVGAAIWVFKNWEEIPDILAKKWDAFKQKMAEVWESVKTAIGEKIGAISDNIAGKWDDIKKSVNTKLTDIRDTIVGWWDNIHTKSTETWNLISGWLSSTWNGIKTNVGTVWGNIRNTIANWWDNINTKTIEVWNTISSWLGSKWDYIKTTATTKWTDIRNTIADWWDKVHSKTTEIWNTISNWLGTKWSDINTTATTKWTEIRDTIANWWEKINTSTTEKWNTISSWLGTTWGNLRTTANTKWTNIKTEISTVIGNTKTAIENKWNEIAFGIEKIWNGIKSTARDIWNEVKENIRGAINGIIGFINQFIRKFNQIKIKVPSVNIPLVGKVGGFTVGMPQIPEIPMLAEGGIARSATVGIFGEAGPEAVVPLPPGVRNLGDLVPDEERIAQAVYQAVITAMRVTQATAPQSGSDREIVLKIGDREIARAVLPAIIHEGQRQGLQLVVRQQGV